MDGREVTEGCQRAWEEKGSRPGRGGMCARQVGWAQRGPPSPSLAPQTQGPFSLDWSLRQFGFGVNGKKASWGHLCVVMMGEQGQL